MSKPKRKTFKIEVPGLTVVKTKCPHCRKKVVIVSYEKPKDRRKGRGE